LRRGALALSLVLVAGGTALANSRLARAEAAEAARLGAFVDALERSRARAVGAPESGTPLLAGFPERAAWQRCQDRLTDPDCADSRRAALGFPPSEPAAGRALLAQLGLDGWAQGPASPAALVVGWGTDELTADGQQLLALSLATLLGSPPPPGPLVDAAARAAQAVAVPGAPPPTRPFPPPARPDEVTSTSVSAERLARGGPGTPDHGAPRGALAAAIRAGEPIPDATWAEPGLSGLAALEVGRAGRRGDLDAVLALSVSGPTSADRLAGLWAALSLAPVDAWSHPEAQARARTLQGAASR